MTACRTRPASGSAGDLAQRRPGSATRPPRARPRPGSSAGSRCSRHGDCHAGAGNAAICGQIHAEIPLLATFAIGRAARAPADADARLLRLSTESRTAISGRRVLRPDPSPPPMRKLILCVALLTAALALVSCRPYGREQPVQPPVPSNPKLLPNSAGIVDRLDGWGPVQQLMVGPGRHRRATTSTPSTPPARAIPCTRSTACAGPAPARWRATGSAIPRAARPAGGGDGHMAVIQPDRWEYDFWQVQDRPAGGGTLLGEPRRAHDDRRRRPRLGRHRRRVRPRRRTDPRRPDPGRARSTTRCSSTCAAPTGEASTPPRRAPPGRSAPTPPNAPPLGARIWLDAERRPDRRAARARLEEDDPARAPPVRRLRRRHDRRQRLLGTPGRLRLDLHELRRRPTRWSTFAQRPAPAALGRRRTTSTWTAAWTGPATCGWSTPAWRRALLSRPVTPRSRPLHRAITSDARGPCRHSRHGRTRPDPLRRESSPATCSAASSGAMQRRRGRRLRHDGGVRARVRDGLLARALARSRADRLRAPLDSTRQVR